MSLFHFLRPEWFIAIFPLIICYWLMRKLQLQNKSWQSFCDKDLLPHLFHKTVLQQNKSPLLLLLLAGLIAIIALAGPSWEQRPQPVFKNQSALIIVLDLSRSMDAEDIKPSRLSRALLKVEDILQQRKEGQTALIVYAGDAFTVTPLTEDTATISSQVKSLNTSIMPLQGSQTDKAIQLAHSLFKQTAQLKGHVLLITDGINERAISLTESLLSPNYTLSVLAVGNPEGAPIPLSSGGFFKDSSGAIVIAKVEQEKLRQLALSGAGSFRFLSADDSDIRQLLKPLERYPDKDQTTATELNTDTWVEAGPWLLLALLPLAAFAFRKGYLFIIVLFILPQSDPVYAFEMNQLWKNQNQQARELFNNNKTQEAAEKFTDSKWKAAAQYKSGQYQKALESYQQLDTTDPDNLYNLANTQAQLGQYDKALESYNKLIEKAPDHSDAKHNREQVEKMLKQQDQKNDTNKKNDNDKSADNKDNKPSDKQSAEQESSADSENQNSDPADKQAEKEPQDQQQQAADKSSTADQSQQDEKQQTENSADDNKDAQSAEQQQFSREQQQANEQWLRRIPDDPGGLLRRKFQYQSQQRPNQNAGDQQW
ncbi:MAG: VWA domain-containing protein [Gammaproteobacteria bacterium]|nr:VWA domain-containing protein [Gammaproteobacteria bacterium]